MRSIYDNSVPKMTYRRFIFIYDEHWKFAYHKINQMFYSFEKHFFSSYSIIQNANSCKFTYLNVSIFHYILCTRFSLTIGNLQTINEIISKPKPIYKR